MRTRRTTATLATVLGLFIGAVAVFAEGPQDELIGQWSGYRMTGHRSSMKKVDHSFTVKALKQLEGGKWDADAVDERGRPMPMTVTVVDGIVYVEYMVRNGSETMELRLQNGAVLQGTALHIGQGRNRDVHLEKQ